MINLALPVTKWLNEQTVSFLMLTAGLFSSVSANSGGIWKKGFIAQQIIVVDSYKIIYLQQYLHPHRQD